MKTQGKLLCFWLVGILLIELAAVADSKKEKKKKKGSVIDDIDLAQLLEDLLMRVGLDFSEIRPVLDSCAPCQVDGRVGECGSCLYEGMVPDQ